MRPEELAANPLNWRIHNQRQRQAYQALRQKVGWAGALLYNLRTQRIIDGHMRLDEAERNAEGEVPVLVGEWSPEDEQIILASLDPIGAMAVTDHAALKSLSQANRATLTGQQTQAASRLRKLTKDLEHYANSVESGDAPSSLLHSELTGRARDHAALSSREQEVPEDDSSPPETGYRPQEEEDTEVYSRPEIKDEVFFPTLNSWGIPELLPELLATPEQAPELTWDRTERTLTDKSYFCQSGRRFLFKPPYATGRDVFPGGCLGFFTEDWRFEHVYEYPSDYAQQLLDEDWTCVVAPDFSMYSDYPFPMRLWNLYRSRWCARYWQELGIRVIPAVQNLEPGPSGLLSEEASLVLDTLPVPCPVLAMQSRTLHRGCTYEGFAALVNTAVERLQPQLVMIYGGYEHQRKFHGYLTRGPEYRMLESYTGARKRKRRVVESKTVPALGTSRPNNRARKVIRTGG
jgi:hypothetical protein